MTSQNGSHLSYLLPTYNDVLLLHWTLMRKNLTTVRYFLHLTVVVCFFGLLYHVYIISALHHRNRVQQQKTQNTETNVKPDNDIMAQLHMRAMLIVNSNLIKLILAPSPCWRRRLVGFFSEFTSGQKRRGISLSISFPFLPFVNCLIARRQGHRFWRKFWKIEQTFFAHAVF